MNKINHHTYMCIYAKYDNIIIPRIPKLVVGYLLKHPEKIHYYLTNRFTIGDVLDVLFRKYLESNKVDILKEIVNYVEGEIWKIS